MREQTSAMLPLPAKTSKPDDLRWEIPIVDRTRRIVGWTNEGPEIVIQDLRHAGAQRLLGAFHACYIEIEDPAEAMRAGAPPGWSAAWRCLALCSIEIATPPPGEAIKIERPIRS